MGTLSPGSSCWPWCSRPRSSSGSKTVVAAAVVAVVAAAVVVVAAAAATVRARVVAGDAAVEAGFRIRRGPGWNRSLLWRRLGCPAAQTRQ